MAVHQFSKKIRVGILAGEASGDLLGSKLIQAVKAIHPEIEFEGVAGPAMIDSGCRSLFDMEELSVMGFIEPLLRLPKLWYLRRYLLKHFLRRAPDIFIGIDAPDFNLGLEYQLRQANIPIIHYVSPSVWAWRQWRVKKIKQSVDLMMTLLPFEKSFYEKHNVPVCYVGHPLADQIPMEPKTEDARRSLCLSGEFKYVALLPGSRRQEIKYLAEPMLRAAQAAYAENHNLRFITSHINEKRYEEFYDYYKQLAPELPLQFFSRRSSDVMAAADVVVVTSGTATLETMLHKKPMVIVYKMSEFTYRIAKRIVKTSFIGLPNLLANDLLVPELIQQAVTADNIKNHISNYLDNPDKVAELQHKFTIIHKTLRTDAASCIANAVMDVIQKKNTL